MGLVNMSKKNKENHLSITTRLLSRRRNDLFLKKIITSDEKCIFYDNVQKGSGLTRMNLSSLPKRKASWKKSYAVYDTITTVLFIFSFKIAIRHTMQQRLQENQLKRQTSEISHEKTWTWFRKGTLNEKQDLF